MTTAIESKFLDREEAALRLAKELEHLRGENPLILAIPRGAVVMGKIIASELEGELDLLLVHKLGHPKQSEYAIGAINEFGDVFITDRESSEFIGEAVLAELAEKEVTRLKTKRQLYTPYRGPIEAVGRTCIIVDDGIATGSTFQAAIKTLKSAGAGKIVVAAPVASRQAMNLLRQEGVELCVLKIPTHFFSVSSHFENFDQVEDEEVIQALSNDYYEAIIDLGDVKVNAILKIPSSARGLVVFAHGSGSGRFSSRNQYVAKRLNENGYATLLADLLTEEESVIRDNVFNIDLLAERVAGLVNWSKNRKSLKRLPVFLFGASTGAGAALKASVMTKYPVRGIISRGGRVDLADEALEHVSVPCLFIVGDLDVLVLDLNRDAILQMKKTKPQIRLIQGASHLFEEPGTLEQVADQVIDWLEEFKTWDSHNKKENSHHAP